MNYSTKIEQTQKIDNCSKSKYVIKTTLNLCSIIIMLCLYSYTAWAYTISGTTLTATDMTDALSATADEKSAITKLIVTAETISGTNYSTGDWSLFKTLNTTGGYTALSDIELSNVTEMPDANSYPATMLFLPNGSTWLKTFSAPKVTVINGDYTFYNVKGLESVNFPALKVGAPYMFYGCSALKTISATNFAALESIGNYMFCACTKLVGLLRFDNVTSIGNYAFSNCDSLVNLAQVGWISTTYSFPKVESLGNYAFSSCEKLTDVDFPKVTKLGTDIFSMCPNLTSMYFDELIEIPTNAFRGTYGLTTIDADFFPKVTTIMRNAFNPNSASETTNKITSITFNSVTTLDSQAFGGTGSYRHIKLEKISFPALETLGRAAFQGCIALRTIDANSFPNLTTLYANAFLDCNNLESIVLPKVTTIEDGTFADNYANLTTIDLSTIQTLSANVFRGCIKLSAISAPLLETIGQGAFVGCTAFPETIDTTLFPSLITIGESAFNGSSVKTIDHTKISTIANYAFSECSALEFVSLPSIATIPSYAFANSHSLSQSSLNFQNVTTIEPNAFNNCQGLISVNQTNFPALTVLDGFNNCLYLREIDFPNVTTVKPTAFTGCVLLSTLNLDAVQTIEGEASSFPNGAFSGCIALTALSDENFPNLKTVGANAFHNCDMLESINLSNVTNIGTAAFGGCTSLASIELPVLLSIEPATEASQAAFYNCNSLQTVDFPVATTINGFANCTNLEEAYFQKATNVGNNAFASCSKLISLGFGSTVETQTPATIGTTAFAGLTTTNIDLYVGAKLTPQPDLANKTWPTAATRWKSIIIEDGLPKTELVFATVPEAVNFTGNRSIARKITITDQIQGSDYSANSEWSKFRTLNPSYPVLEEIEILTNQNIPDGIPNNTGLFYQADWLKKFSAPNVKSIGWFSFHQCTALSDINFPSVTTIGLQAFAACVSLSNVSFPAVTNVNEFAFNVSNMSAINFPSVTTVGAAAFSSGSNLSSVSFGTNFTVPTNISFVDRSTQEPNDYPVFNQTATENVDLTLSEYVLPIPDFAANTWNGYEWKSISVGNIPTELTFETVTEALDYKGYVHAVRKVTIAGQIQGSDYSENSEWSKLNTLNETYPALTELAILTEQAIPNRDTMIIEGKNTYRSLTYIYDGTTSKYNTWLQAFSAPNTVSIGSWAFYRSAALESVTFTNAKTVNTMAFSGCNKLTSISQAAFPQLTTIGNWAFSSCENITEINFPMAFEVQGNAFSQCATLTKIVLPKITNIGFGAFFECNAINNVTLGTDFMFPAEIRLDASAGAEIFAPQTDLTLGYYVIPEPTPLNDNTESSSTELRLWHTYTWRSINIIGAPDYLYTVILLTAPEAAGTTMLSNAGSRDLVSIRAIPANDCYHFIGWADNYGTIITEDNPFELALTRDTTLTAVFRQDSVELQITASAGGTVTPNGNVVIPCGEDLTITATANEGYLFANWSNAVTGTIISNNATETLTLEQYKAHPSIMAKFVKEDEPPVIEYSVTLLANPTNAGTLTGAGRYNENATVTVTAIANEGYVFDNWTNASGTAVSEDASYSFTLTSDITLTANFTHAVPTITTQPQSQEVAAGGTFTLNVVATGLGLQYQWQKDGGDITGATSATYTKSDVATVDSGSYVCIVSNSAGNVTSEAAVIKVVQGIEEYVSSFSLTPNPTPDFVTVKMDVLQAGKLEVSLIDLTGAELISLHNSFTEAGLFTKSFSLANLPPAVYYLRIMHSGNVRIEKIIRN